MYRIRRRTPTIGSTLQPSLARGGTARVVALLFIQLVVLSSIAFSQTSGDLVSASNCRFEDGIVSIGYLQNDSFVPYNTPFTVCKGVVGWCLDKCPGVDGDVTLNMTKEPITSGGFTWQPGIIYLNPSTTARPVAFRFKPSKSQAFSCVASVAVKPGSGEAVTVGISKNATSVANATMDTAQKQESVVLSCVAEASTTDSLYFIVSNIENQLGGLVGVQLFVTPDAAKIDPAGSIKPAFVSSTQ